MFMVGAGAAVQQQISASSKATLADIMMAMMMVVCEYLGGLLRGL